MAIASWRCREKDQNDPHRCYQPYRPSSGSATPASAKPARAKWQLSQRPQGRPCGVRVVAAVRQAVVETKREPLPDDLGLGQRDAAARESGSVRAFTPARGGQRRQPLERRDEFGTAIGIAGVIERIDADEDVAWRQAPRPIPSRATERWCSARGRRSTESRPGSIGRSFGTGDRHWSATSRRRPTDRHRARDGARRPARAPRRAPPRARARAAGRIESSARTGGSHPPAPSPRPCTSRARR